MTSPAIIPHPADAAPGAIPEFPDFKPVEIGDRAEVEARCRRFPPYSNFNFVSLLCWEPSEASILRGNLVMRLRAYVSGQMVYSVLGDADIADTCAELISHLGSQGLPPELRLVPEATVVAGGAALAGRFSVEASEADFDYLMSPWAMASLDGPGLRQKLRDIDIFREAHPAHRFGELDLAKRAGEVEALCGRWREARGAPDESVRAEFDAIARCARHADALGLLCVGLFVGDRLAGFAVNEAVGRGFAVVHFAKSDPAMRGADKALHVENAARLLRRGCVAANYEEDLGLPGLRQSKRSWAPFGYLRKYVVRERGA